MRQHFQDEHLLTPVDDAGNQPVLVAGDVEDDAIAYDAGAAEYRLNVAPRVPGDCLTIDVRIPST